MRYGERGAFPMSFYIKLQKGYVINEGGWGGGGYVFFLKKYSDSQCCWKKYSDFGGGKKI
jgi:hypothetical protein